MPNSKILKQIIIEAETNYDRSNYFFYKMRKQFALALDGLELKLFTFTLLSAVAEAIINSCCEWPSLYTAHLCNLIEKF